MQNRDITLAGLVPGPCCRVPGAGVVAPPDHHRLAVDRTGGVHFLEDVGGGDEGGVPQSQELALVFLGQPRDDVGVRQDMGHRPPAGGGRGLDAAQEHVGDLIVGPLLRTRGEHAATVERRRQVGHEGRRVRVAVQVVHGQPACQPALGDLEQLGLGPLADQSVSLLLHADEQTKPLVVLPFRQLSQAGRLASLAVHPILLEVAATELAADSFAHAADVVQHDFRSAGVLRLGHSRDQDGGDLGLPLHVGWLPEILGHGGRPPGVMGGLAQQPGLGAGQAVSHPLEDQDGDVLGLNPAAQGLEEVVEKRHGRFPSASGSVAEPGRDDKAARKQVS